VPDDSSTRAYWVRVRDAHCISPTGGFRSTPQSRSKQTRHPPLVSLPGCVHRSLSKPVASLVKSAISKDPRAGNAMGSSSSSSTSACGRMNRHRARCRGSASTSDEHVLLCASRAGRQRPRRLRFRSDGHHLVYRTLQRRPGERAAFCAAWPQPLRPGAVALFPRRGHHQLHPHVSDQHFDLRPPRSSPLPGGRTANHSGGADYRREGRPILAGFACAVNPGVLSGSPGVGG
jgi:hypothetical protein